jgi:pimeloyl-ACP methyl ester carboxylesterase
MTGSLGMRLRERLPMFPSLKLAAKGALAVALCVGWGLGFQDCAPGSASAPSPSSPASPSPGAAGVAASPECFGGDVTTLPVPYYYGRADSPTLNYKFQIKRAADPGMPWVIVIPGGPGAPSIGYAALAGGSIPSAYNVVYTDPRGSNCNAPPGGHLPLDAYRTEYLARDVKAIIESLQLDDFLIYGHSYGTVQATVLASLLEQESRHKPRALVLEGILGRHLDGGFAEQISAFDAQWQLVRNGLLPTVADSFLREPLPLGFTSRQWALFITESLYEGVIPGTGIRLQILLNELARHDPDTEASLTKYFLNELNGSFIYLVDPNVNAIGCRELYGSIVGRDLREGHLVPAGDDTCLSLQVAFSNPYDSASWQTRAPIYYFEGTNDPATPPKYAAYHFATHPQSSRHFAYVEGAAHDPLTQTLATAGCSKAVWDEIGTESGRLRAALDQCSNVVISLTEAPPQ